MKRFSEYVKLLFRAAKYRFVDDPAGIRYLISKIKKGDTVMDIGAHKGGYTYWMKKAAGRKGKVIAFEPQEKGYRLLQLIFPGTVIVERLAVSDHEAVQQLYIQPQKYQVSFEASLEKQYENSIQETIQTISVDDYCLRNNLKPDLIKIDVEGHERKVIEGAIQTISSHKPVFMIECESRHSGKDAIWKLNQILEENGYTGFFFYRNSKYMISHFNEREHQSHPGNKDYINNFIFEPIVGTPTA